MSPLRRRRWLQAALGSAAPAWAEGRALENRTPEDRIESTRRLMFPRDHGAHLGSRIEWWYATGWLQDRPAGALVGFQITYFRSRTGLAQDLPGRFAPRQLLFAHAAISDIGAKTHRHAQRITRWSGDESLPEAHVSRADTALVLGRWAMHREDGAYRAQLAAPEAGFTLSLQLKPTQTLLLQGEAGFSRKGPRPSQASYYYSQPQLAVSADLSLGGQRRSLPGRGWIDHEWSDELLPDDAVGWDWIGINLSDGGALTAFVLRRADGSQVWAGGSHRAADTGEGATARNFGSQEVSFEPLRQWISKSTGARYPVHWRIRSPAGNFELRALMDDQELDSRASTGTVYWEGLAELLGANGVRLGLGYLEMTGRAQPLKLWF